jgi:hypothetical protein
LKKGQQLVLFHHCKRNERNKKAGIPSKQQTNDTNKTNKQTNKHTDQLTMNSKDKSSHDMLRATILHPQGSSWKTSRRMSMQRL